MSNLLTLTAKSNVHLAKISLIYDGSSYKVLCTCRIHILGTDVDEVVIPIHLTPDLTLHVDMFSAAIKDHLERR